MAPPKVEPGRDPQMADRTRKLNVVFALTSIGLLITFSLMIWYDYARPWKKHQNEFTLLEVKRTEVEIQEALGKVDAGKRKALEEQIARGAEEKKARRQEIEKVEDELDKLDGEWYRVDQDYRFTKAKIDVARYEYEEAEHKGARSADEEEGPPRGAREAVGRAEAEARGRDRPPRRRPRPPRRAGEDEHRGGQDGEGDLRGEDPPRREAEEDPARVRLLRAQHARHRHAEPVAEGQPDPAREPHRRRDLHRHARRWTAARPATSASTRRGTRTRPSRTPRTRSSSCTCRAPHPMERIGCTACHQGRGRATSFVGAVHTPSTPEQEKAWGKYTGSDTYHRLHHWDLPMTAKGTTEAQCVKCHQGVVEIPQADTLNTGTMLIERYGCYGCHKIKGWEDLRKVGPDLTKILSKTDEEWMLRWVEEPKAFRPTRMPQVWNVRPHETPEQLRRNDVEINSVVAYLAGKSGIETYPDPPARRPGGGPQGLRDHRLPGLPPRRRRQARDRRLPDRVLPRPRPQPRRHRQQGEAGLALRLGAQPEGLLARDADARPAAHREGSGRHHRVPDEPEERRLPRPPAAGERANASGTRSSASTSSPPASPWPRWSAGWPGWTTRRGRCSSARRPSAATGASAATTSPASRRPRPSASSSPRKDRSSSSASTSASSTARSPTPCPPGCT